MIRIGIVGTGATVSIAHFHCEGYKKDARCTVTAVYDINREAAEKWVAAHGLSARVCGSYEELLEYVDAVDICTPNILHYPQACVALRAGRHVLIEKPMAVSLQESRLLAQAADAADRCVMVAMVYRYANSVRLARRIAMERLGQMYTLTGWFGGKRLADPTVPIEWRMLRERSGSGALGDFGSHLIDLAFYVAGQRYENVMCKTGVFISERASMGGVMQAVENDDAAMFVAQGPKGLGSFTMSRVGMDDVMLMLVGEGGMLQVSLRAPEQVLYWEKTTQGAYTGVVHPYTASEQKPFDGWFDSEMSAFLDAVEGNREDMPDATHGCYIEEVLAAAERSSLTGKDERVGDAVCE